MKPCYLFDLDGTLANGDHRVHLIRDKTPKDWPAYFAACVDDAPIPHMIKLAWRLGSLVDILIVTGRSDEVRAETMAWLHKHLGTWVLEQDVLMRKAGIKIEMLAVIRARGFEPIMAFEDRDRVVAAWRAAGIPCMQVAPGDF